jgi:hypothetical protein
LVVLEIDDDGSAELLRQHQHYPVETMDNLKAVSIDNPFKTVIALGGSQRNVGANQSKTINTFCVLEFNHNFSSIFILFSQTFHLFLLIENTGLRFF